MSVEAWRRARVPRPGRFSGRDELDQHTHRHDVHLIQTNQEPAGSAGTPLFASRQTGHCRSRSSLRASSSPSAASPRRVTTGSVALRAARGTRSHLPTPLQCNLRAVSRREGATAMAVGRRTDSVLSRRRSRWRRGRQCARRRRALRRRSLTRMPTRYANLRAYPVCKAQYIASVCTAFDTVTVCSVISIWRAAAS